MKLKLLLAASLLTFSGANFAKDAPTLNDKVDTEVKAAVEAAQTTVKALKAAKVEWFWAKGKNIGVKGKKVTHSKLVNQAIGLANDGKNDEALKITAYIESTAKAALKQAEVAKNAGPRF